MKVTYKGDTSVRIGNIDFYPGETYIVANDLVLPKEIFDFEKEKVESSSAPLKKVKSKKSSK